MTEQPSLKLLHGEGRALARFKARAACSDDELASAIFRSENWKEAARKMPFNDVVKITQSQLENIVILMESVRDLLDDIANMESVQAAAIEADAEFERSTAEVVERLLVVEARAAFHRGAFNDEGGEK